jgi:hypothetical protein
MWQIRYQGRGGPGPNLLVWLKILGTTEKKNFILIILVKQQTIYEITTNKTCMSKLGTPTKPKISIKKRNQQINKLYQKNH